MSFSKNGLCGISSVVSRSLRNTLQNWNPSLTFEQAKVHSQFSKLSWYKFNLVELLVMQLVDLYPWAYLNKSSVWNSFLFSDVKEEREYTCLLINLSNFGGEHLKE